jgi:hypothetical protein
MRPTLMQFHPALRRSLVFILPLAVLLAAILARVAISNILDRLSLICFDFYQRAAPREAGEAPIRIVDIDDDSLAKVGQWPWPRATIAQLIDKLVMLAPRSSRSTSILPNQIVPRPNCCFRCLLGAGLTLRRHKGSWHRSPIRSATCASDTHGPTRDRVHHGGARGNSVTGGQKAGLLFLEMTPG